MADDKPRHELVSRKDALARGMAHYSGLPCIFGHEKLRYAKNASCVECSKIRTKLYRSVRSEPHRQRTKEVDRRRKKKVRRLDPAGDRKKQRENYQKHAVARKKDASEWRRANPDKVRAYANNRRAKVLQAKGTHTAEDVANIFVLQRGRCAYCKISLLAYEVDHIVPISKGGANDRSNLQIVCKKCNRAKSAKGPIEFAQELGRLL